MIAALAFPVPPRDPELAGPRSVEQNHTVRRHRSLRQRGDLVWLKTASEEYVPALHVRRPSGQRAVRFTLLYSHGNAEDLGQIASWVDEMARACDADVLAYEYIGYSIATGTPSEENCYLSANAAYDYLIKQETPHESIVPFGRSLGSGSAVHIAAAAERPCGGLLLQSPLLSGAYAVFGEVRAIQSNPHPGCSIQRGASECRNARACVRALHTMKDPQTKPSKPHFNPQNPTLTLQSPQLCTFLRQGHRDDGCVYRHIQELSEDWQGALPCVRDAWNRRPRRAVLERPPAARARQGPAPAAVV